MLVTDLRRISDADGFWSRQLSQDAVYEEAVNSRHSSERRQVVLSEAFSSCTPMMSASSRAARLHHSGRRLPNCLLLAPGKYALAQLPEDPSWARLIPCDR